jgi:hypothetical protein
MVHNREATILDARRWCCLKELENFKKKKTKAKFLVDESYAKKM